MSEENLLNEQILDGTTYSHTNQIQKQIKKLTIQEVFLIYHSMKETKNYLGRS